MYHQLSIFDQQQYRAEARPNVPKLNTKIEYCIRSVRAGNTEYQHSRKPWTLCATLTKPATMFEKLQSHFERRFPITDAQFAFAKTLFIPKNVRKGEILLREGDLGK